MANDKLILRTLSSPFTYPNPDNTKNSVLSWEDVDNNFIFLKGRSISGLTYANDTITIKLTDGTNYPVVITGISSDTFVTGGTVTGDTLMLYRNDNVTISIDLNSDDLYWTSGSSGNYSIKAKNNSGLDATADYSIAEGHGTTALGPASHAEGTYSIAQGDSSHAEGIETITYGSSSHAEGCKTIAESDYSHAEGYITKAIGHSSHSEGFKSTAIGQNSHAEGTYTTAIGISSHAEGSNTTAQGESSHVEGEGTTAQGNYSHAEGYYSTTQGDYSHAEGYYTITNGSVSHAEGYKTTAEGFYSHSEGYNTIASGPSSHVGGMGFDGYFINASGTASFNHQYCDSYVEGASGDYSAILGGVNSIASGKRTVVLGGQNINGNEDDTVYVPNLNINYTPINNTGDILVRTSNGTVAISNTLSNVYFCNIQSVGASIGEFELLKVYTQSEGYSPKYSLLEYNGKIYGCTLTGGIYNNGTIFEYDPVTSGYTDIYNHDTSTPSSGLIQYNGKLYGTISSTYGYLYEFDLTTSATTLLVDFNTVNGNMQPKLIIESGGTIFGTTNLGGTMEYGTIFKYEIATSAFTILHNFDYINGAYSESGVIEHNGKLYGTTISGGNYGNGVIFEYVLNSSTYNKLYDLDFNSSLKLNYYNNKLYGLSPDSGLNNKGCIYEFDLITSSLTILFNFDEANGAYPYSEMLEYGGKLYGMTSGGGTNGYGVIFEYDITTSGYSLLHEFNGNDGYEPYSSFAILNNILYGTASLNTPSDYGTLFRYNLTAETLCNIGTYETPFDYIYAGNLNLDSITSGTPVNNIGIDSDGNLILVPTGGASSNKFVITTEFTGSVLQTITHNLGTEDIIVQIWDSSKQLVSGTVQINNSNPNNAVDVTLSVGGTYKIVIIA